MPKIRTYWKKWIFVFLLVILFFMVMGLNSSLSEYFQLTDQRNQMIERIDNLEATQYALETQIAYADSDKAVEEWARTFQRYIQPGDNVIIPLSPEDVTKEVNYLETPTPSSEENWQVWWEMFFGN